MMALFTKFPRTKVFTVAGSLTALALLWGTFAWPGLTSAKSAPNPQVEAMKWLATLTAEQRAALIAVAQQPAPAAPPPLPVGAAAPRIVHKVVVIHRAAAGAPAGAPAPNPWQLAQAPVAVVPSRPTAPPAPASAPAPAAPPPVAPVAARPAPPPAPAPATTTRAS